MVFKHVQTKNSSTSVLLLSLGRSSYSSTSLSAATIRGLRAKIVSASEDNGRNDLGDPFAAITGSADFYSNSGFRDMMAHPVVSQGLLQWHIERCTDPFFCLGTLFWLEYT